MSNLFLSLVAAVAITEIFGEGIIGSSSNTVVLVNNTGLKVARIIVGERTYEDPDFAYKTDKMLVNVTPKPHHMEIVFRGGTHIDWRHFNFNGIHQITFVLVGNRVSAHIK